MGLQNGLYVVDIPFFYRILIVCQPWVLDEEPSMEIMKAAWDLGINTIDTANIYSNGESERLIGKFIKKVGFKISLHMLMATVLTRNFDSTIFHATRS